MSLLSGDAAVRMQSDVSIALTTVGGYNEETGLYEPASEQDVTDGLITLNMYLRRATSGEVLWLMHDASVLTGHLLPLLCSPEVGEKTRVRLLKTLVLTTAPSCAEAEDRHGEYQKLREAKDFAVKGNVIPALMAAIVEPLSQDTDRTDRDKQQIELVLSVLRNLLAIPNATRHSVDVHFRYLQEEMILRMADEGVWDVLLLLAQDIERHDYNDWKYPLLDILFHALKVETAKSLATKPLEGDAERSAAAREAKVRKEVAESRLAQLRAREAAERRKTSLAISGTRHARFGGLFLHKADEALSKRGRAGTLMNATFTEFKNMRSVARSRATHAKPKATESARDETDSQFFNRRRVQQVLRDFLAALIDSAAFFKFASTIFFDLDKQASSDDETQFAEVLRYVLQFNRLREGGTQRLQLVGSAVNERALQWAMEKQNRFQVEQRAERKLSQRNWKPFESVTGLLAEQVALRSTPEALGTPEGLAAAKTFFKDSLQDRIVEYITHFFVGQQSLRYLADLLALHRCLMRMYDHYEANGGDLTRTVTKKKRKTKIVERVEDDDTVSGFVRRLLARVVDRAETEQDGRKFQVEEYSVMQEWSKRLHVQQKVTAETMVRLLPLMRTYEQQTDTTLLNLSHFVRVAVTNKESLIEALYRLPFLIFYNEVLTEKRLDRTALTRGQKDIVALARQMTRKFFRRAEEDHEMFVSIVFKGAASASSGYHETFAERVSSVARENADLVDGGKGGRKRKGAAKGGAGAAKVPRKRARWTDDDDAKLTELFAKFGDMASGDDTIASMMDKTPDQIKRRRKVLSLGGGAPKRIVDALVTVKIRDAVLALLRANANAESTLMQLRSCTLDQVPEATVTNVEMLGTAEFRAVLDAAGYRQSDKDGSWALPAGLIAADYKAISQAIHKGAKLRLEEQAVGETDSDEDNLADAAESSEEESAESSEEESDDASAAGSDGGAGDGSRRVAGVAAVRMTLKQSAKRARKRALKRALMSKEEQAAEDERLLSSIKRPRNNRVALRDAVKAVEQAEQDAKRSSIARVRAQLLSDSDSDSDGGDDAPAAVDAAAPAADAAGAGAGEESDVDTSASVVLGSNGKPRRQGLPILLDSDSEEEE